MIEVLSLAEEDTQLHKVAVNEMAGPCPGCGGKDRFRVRYSQDTGIWRFMCRTCYDAGQYIPEKGCKRGWGDTINYLRHFRGKTYQEAKTLTDGQEPAQHRDPTPARYLSDEWQATTHAAMLDHQERLGSDDHIALEYARGRGLYDHTIKQFQLGYSLHRGIPYLVIPSINEGHYVSVECRDLRTDRPEGVSRWTVASGSAKDELYLADCLDRDPNKPVVLCEDALSALSVYQECGDLVNVVAICGVKCCMTTKWLARLACMPLVLIALDADAEGDARSAEWLKRLKNARRLRPLLKDANDMLMDSWDLREWVMSGLESVAPKPEEDRCMVCRISIGEDQGIDGFYSEDGRYTCSLHVAPAVALVSSEGNPAETCQPAEKEDYWTRTERKLAGIDFSSPAPVVKPRTYPTAFPCRQMVIGEDGRPHLEIVGMWDPAECGLVGDAAMQVGESA